MRAVTGVLGDRASQSHNFGPLNLLVRMLKSLTRLGLTTIQFFRTSATSPLTLPLPPFTALFILFSPHS